MHFLEKKRDDLHLTVTILYILSYFEATSVTTKQLDLHCSYDLSVLTWCGTTLAPSLLCFSSHFCLFCSCGISLSLCMQAGSSHPCSPPLKEKQACPKIAEAD